MYSPNANSQITFQSFVPHALVIKFIVDARKKIPKPACVSDMYTQPVRNIYSVEHRTLGAIPLET
jgi:hypothetical protein